MHLFAYLFCVLNFPGLLTNKRRFVRIVNTLTSQDDLLEVRGHHSCKLFPVGQPFMCISEWIWHQVATEETLDEIKTRYLKYNLHAGSYLWVWNRMIFCRFLFTPPLLPRVFNDLAELLLLHVFILITHLFAEAFRSPPGHVVDARSKWHPRRNRSCWPTGAPFLLSSTPFFPVKHSPAWDWVQHMCLVCVASVTLNIKEMQLRFFKSWSINFDWFFKFNCLLFFCTNRLPVWWPPSMCPPFTCILKMIWQYAKYRYRVMCWLCDCFTYL